MKDFYKVLSVVLHPVFLPTIATLIYLLVLPQPLHFAQQSLVFAMVFGATCLVPLLTLYLLKLVGYIKTFQAESIQERKLPVVIMIVNYLFLAQVLQEIWQLRELTILAYSTAIGLIITSFLFYAKTKLSLHILGMAGIISFALLYGANYQYANKTIALLVLLLGALATARLQLKAHNFREVILGLSFGLLTPMLLSYFL
ncbi:hypothetical protein ACXGQW_04315 [Wenyingzhuangia sp. IMCC45533]